MLNDLKQILIELGADESKIPAFTNFLNDYINDRVDTAIQRSDRHFQDRLGSHRDNFQDRLDNLVHPPQNDLHDHIMASGASPRTIRSFAEFRGHQR